MNKTRIALSIAAAGSLAAAPLVSAAAAQRASAPVSAENDLGGGGALAFVAIGILAAYIAITVSNGDEDDEPSSP